MLFQGVRGLDPNSVFAPALYAIIRCIQFIQFNLDYLSWIYWSNKNQISASDKLKLLLNLRARAGERECRKVVQEGEEGGRARRD